MTATACRHWPVVVTVLYLLSIFYRVIPVYHTDYTAAPLYPICHAVASFLLYYILHSTFRCSSLPMCPPSHMHLVLGFVLSHVYVLDRAVSSFYGDKQGYSFSSGWGQLLLPVTVASVVTVGSTLLAVLSWVCVTAYKLRISRAE